MILLPIVARELRVNARQWATYRARLALALVSILIGTGIFIATLGSPAAQAGRNIFIFLAGLQFIYCLAYGRRSTADCLSSEKRDGTLGLLFLTDLKGHDVVLGKLVATSLKGFYALMAIFPVLAVPLLMGGTSNGEFWRMVLVLLNTFLFSLAIGVFGSALSRDFRRAMAANLVLLLLFVAVPPAISAAIAYFTRRPFIPELFFSCPAYAFYLCDDKRFGVEGVKFWSSVAIVHAITWFLILLASVIVPRSWQDQPGRTSKNLWRGFWRIWNYGAASKQSAFRKQLLDQNAFYWLAARVTRKPAHVWTFLGCMAAWWLIGWMTSGPLWFDPSIIILTALMLNCALKVWLAIVAGQQLAEDKKSGAFELLLTVPLTVRDILHGQLLALRRQFLAPLLAVLAVELVLMRLMYARSFDRHVLMMWLVGIFVLLADIAALSSVAMFSALTTKSHNHATFRTLLRVLFLPWLCMGLVMAAGNLWYVLGLGKEWSLHWPAYVGLWFAFSLAVDLAFGLTALFQLHNRFRQLALQAFNPPTAAPVLVENVSNVATVVLPRTTSHGALTPAPVVQDQIQQPSEFLKRRKSLKKVAFVSAVLLLGVGFFGIRFRAAFRPPVLVVLTQSNAPVRVFPNPGGSFFILPDGSLWQWGQASGMRIPRAAQPEQVGTNTDWVEAVRAGTHSVGLRKDGTIWEWGLRSGRVTTIPEQVDAGHLWTGIAASFTHSLALRQDGTIWAWGDNSMSQLGNGPGPATTILVQVGTNNDWMAVCCPWLGNLALKRDGTLWTWGPSYVFASGQGSPINIPTPTQVCRETNWVAFVNAFTPLVRSRSGDLWSPFYGTPDANATVGSTCRLMFSNASPERIASAICKTPQVFELRPNGTLWAQSFPLMPGMSTPIGNWRQVGKRSDWVSLWSGSGTAFGLTKDGTLWTWGIDLGRDPAPDFLSRLKLAQTRVMTFFSPTPPPVPGPVGSPMKPAYQIQPRPLLRLLPANNQ
jgi:ABC-type transport system involved in multi-copper enzyme maturation permease subunit